MARRTGAKMLILGHFSKAYTDEDAHVAEAKEEFSGEVIAANEGMTIKILQ